MIILEIKDKTGRIIHLSKERWQHICEEHPVIANKIDYIKDTLENPSFITKSESDIDVNYYYKYYKKTKLRAKYLLVLVKYLNDKGFIITSFYTDKIK